MRSFLSKLLFLLSRRDRLFLAVLFALSILSALVETIGLSAIMPFISVATNMTLVETNGYYKTVYDALGFATAAQFVIAFGFVLIGFYIFRSGLQIFSTWLLVRFANSRFHIFAYRLFSQYLAMPYQEFAQRNSARLTKTIMHDANQITTVINNFLQLISEVSIVVILYTMMIMVNWKVTIVLSLFLATQVFLLLKFVSSKIAKHGRKSQASYAALMETINDSLGNFKLVKLLGNQKLLLERFGSASLGYSQSKIANEVLNALPRIVLELLGFSILIALVVYVIYQYGDANFVIPIVSMFALALYRLLPSAQRIMGNINSIRFYLPSLHIVHQDLLYRADDEGGEPIAFERTITLKNINFAFSEDKPVINDLTLTIQKGDKIGFAGKSGSGKSTLIDIIAGIYKPQSGEIEIDGETLRNDNIRAWRQLIGYIPQEIYLFDGTVADNVAFGHDYDEAEIIAALKQANIYDFLLTHDGLKTRVGEGGILLSGGQKQRIGIARALYGNPQILILDEATSALDSETEAKIMEEIYDAASGRTLLAIAHRLTTLSGCNRIYQMESGRLD
ncbi:multidrug transporter [Campylobacterota bacterium]|nr:multidrug transporter [Campylobacterota bacterium]